MGESRATYQTADLVAELAAQVRANRADLLDCTITQLRPVYDAFTTRELGWYPDDLGDKTSARFAAVFLDLLFDKLGATEFDKPISALGSRIYRDAHGNVLAHNADLEALTGVASDLITAAWYELVGIDYAATAYVLSHEHSRNGWRLRLAIYGGGGGSNRPVETELLAACSPWAHAIETGKRDLDQARP